MKNYKFKVVKPLEEACNLTGAIFLAGPCPRSNYHEDWRYEAFEILDELGFTGTVITPTNDQYMEMKKEYGNDMLRMQTEWERKMMHICSTLVFWVPRSEKRPAFTTNIEYGEWYKRNGVYFGFPEGALLMEYLTIKYAEQQKSWYNDLRTMLRDVVSDLQSSKESKWFTADTHFGQQRTLELSCRPFVDVTEMDLQMISNWNKSVRPNDIVYHAGDFVDYTNFGYLKELLSNLNFKTLHWVLGNYDRKYKNEIIHIADEFNQISERGIVLYDQKDGKGCLVSLTNPDGQIEKFEVIHEPVDFPVLPRDGVTYLFGHIHGRNFAKRNGIDLGTDYHQFSPIPEEKVLWYRNAMHFWDENVYSDRVLVK